MTLTLGSREGCLSYVARNLDLTATKSSVSLASLHKQEPFGKNEREFRIFGYEAILFYPFK